MPPTCTSEICAISIGQDATLRPDPRATRLLISEAPIVAAAPSTAIPPAGALSRFADLELDRLTRQVRRAGRLVELTPTEFSLLELFLEHPQVVLARSLIFKRVWGFDFGPTSNLLNVYVGYLRRKLGEPRLIHTSRGIGYVLREARAS